MNVADSMAPRRVKMYGDLIDSSAIAYGVDPLIVAAIGDRETYWGTSKDLDKPGPEGTGDFGKRNPARWGSALPPDGRGWGRGLMQIDYGGHKDWCDQLAADGRFLWECPAENIHQGCAILHANMTALNYLPAAICAYNAGAGTAFRIMGQCAGRNLNDAQIIATLDAVTSGGDYVSWCLARRDAFAGACLGVS